MTLERLKGAAIAFDLDGTLVDTAPDLVRALNISIAPYGLAACAGCGRARHGGTRGARR